VPGNQAETSIFSPAWNVRKMMRSQRPTPLGTRGWNGMRQRSKGTSNGAGRMFASGRLRSLSAFRLFEQFQNHLHDLVLRAHFQITRLGTPRFVATQPVVLHRRQVVVVSVRQADDELAFQR